MAFLELLVALVLGIFSGIITGLVPGIHVNLVSVLVISFAPVLFTFVSPIVVAVYVITLAITHTFLDAIPSIYLGAPDAGQELNVLPGHRLLHKGEGHNALVYTVLGSLGCLLLGLLLFPLFIGGMKILDPYISAWVGYILALIMLYMIGKEKRKRLQSFTLFLISGVLGMLVFSIPTLHQPLFPLLSGLFGLSLLCTSLFQKSMIPKQHLSKPLSISSKNASKAIGSATGMGFIAAFLPGFGSSQAAIIATNIVGDIGDEGFLTMVGGINTANMLISIATAYVLDKARNGAIVAVRELIQGIGFQEMMLFLGAALIAGGVAAILAMAFSKVFSHYIVKVNYFRLVLTIILFIVALSIYFDGVIGLIILVTSTSVGLVATSWGIGKNHLMGCLILPVILFFVL